MNNTTQQDLFQTTFISGGDKASRAEAPKPTMFLERFRFSIRLDQVLVILIGMLLVCVVVFSLGYEKGKQLGDAKLRLER